MDDAGDQSVPCFEEALLQLEKAVRRLESGELDLADALDCYEQGIQQLKHCYRLLEDAERRVELLTGVDADGNPVTQDFADDELSLEEKRTTRGARRTHAARRSPRRSEASPASEGDDPEGLF